MKKNKLRPHNAFSLLRLMVIGGVFIVITALIFDKVIPAENTVNSSTPTAKDPEQHPKDSVENGIYINNEYRYKVAIPTDKFVQEYAYPFWIYSDNGYYLKLSISVRTEHERALYEDIFALSNGETYEKYTASTFKKLSSKNYPDYKLVTTWSKTAPDQEIEHSVAYSAIWLHKNKPPIVLALFTQPEYESYLEQNKDIFDDIVKNFQFF